MLTAGSGLVVVVGLKGRRLGLVLVPGGVPGLGFAEWMLALGVSGGRPYLFRSGLCFLDGPTSGARGVSWRGTRGSVGVGGAGWLALLGGRLLLWAVALGASGWRLAWFGAARLEDAFFGVAGAGGGAALARAAVCAVDVPVGVGRAAALSPKWSLFTWRVLPRCARGVTWLGTRGSVGFGVVGRLALVGADAVRAVACRGRGAVGWLGLPEEA